MAILIVVVAMVILIVAVLLVGLFLVYVRKSPEKTKKVASENLSSESSVSTVPTDSDSLSSPTTSSPQYFINVQRTPTLEKEADFHDSLKRRDSGSAA